MNAVTLSLGAGILSVLYGIYLSLKIVRQPMGTPDMNAIAAAIAEGAQAFLSRQYKTIGILAVGITALLYFTLGQFSAIAFAIGAVCSAVAGFIGMNISVRANVRTTQAAKTGLAAALSVAFSGGAVTGLMVAGLALASIAVTYMIISQNPLHIDLKPLVALGFGGSLISVFARLGGGIYTKGADVGTDMVGKIEKGIPEDDPRNPGVIADLVGDNVGDDAGMAADLFETYVVTAVAAILLGRIGIFEVFPVSPEIAKKIAARAPMKDIEDTAIAEGMMTMKQDGYQKALEGTTTLEEVLRVAQD